MDKRSSAPDGTGRAQSASDNFVEGYGGGSQRNPKTQPGNGDGQGRLQPGGNLGVEGYPRKVSKPDVQKTGRSVPAQGHTRGYGGNAGDVNDRGIKERTANGGVGGLKRVKP